MRNSTKTSTPDPRFNPDRLKNPREVPERSRYADKTDAEVAADLQRRFKAADKNR